jgi:hypothetical protein
MNIDSYWRAIYRQNRFQWFHFWMHVRIMASIRFPKIMKELTTTVHSRLSVSSSYKRFKKYRTDNRAFNFFNTRFIAIQTQSIGFHSNYWTVVVASSDHRHCSDHSMSERVRLFGSRNIIGARPYSGTAAGGSADEPCATHAYQIWNRLFIILGRLRTYDTSRLGDWK